jgi:hypothetical protein
MSHRTPHPGQLDLFLHQGPVVFANDAVDALCRRDAPCAEECIQRLLVEEPAYRTLGALQTLCRALRTWPPPAANLAQIADVVARLETEVLPAAETAMGAKAQGFMGPFWRDLANAAVTHLYHADYPQSFCAGLYLRCGDCRAAADAAQSIAHWENNPDALYWLTLARYGLGGLAACRPALMRLALLAPGRLSAAVAEIRDPLLQQDWSAFQDDCAWLDPRDEQADAWFPAWYRLQHSAADTALESVPLPPTPAAQAYILIGRLIGLERDGYSAELIAARQALQGQEPALFTLYMARREGGIAVDMAQKYPLLQI